MEDEMTKRKRLRESTELSEEDAGWLLRDSMPLDWEHPRSAWLERAMSVERRRLASST